MKPTQLIALSSALVLVTGGAPREAEAACGFQCGVNTAEIRKTPINGLHLGGKENPDGVFLVPGSLRLGAPSVMNVFARATCRDALRLGKLSLAVVNGQLTAVDPEGRALAPMVASACMRGATFDISIPASKEGAAKLVTRVRIDDRAATTTWFKKPEKRTWVPAYKLSYLVEGQYVGVCDNSTSWIEDWQRSFDPDAQSAVAPGAPPLGHRKMTAGEGSGYALIVQGELYDNSSAEVRRHEPQWFNIACSGSALAKMRLMGVDPMKEQNPELTMATLRMITAKYVDAWSGTVDGMPIYWVRVGQEEAFIGAPTRDYFGPPEARWNAKGALCADHFRIWRQAFDPVTERWRYRSEQHQRDKLALPSCGAADEPGLWQSVTIDHAPH